MKTKLFSCLLLLLTCSICAQKMKEPLIDDLDKDEWLTKVVPRSEKDLESLVSFIKKKEGENFLNVLLNEFEIKNNPESETRRINLWIHRQSTDRGRLWSQLLKRNSIKARRVVRGENKKTVNDFQKFRVTKEYETRYRVVVTGLAIIEFQKKRSLSGSVGNDKSDSTKVIALANSEVFKKARKCKNDSCSDYSTLEYVNLVDTNPRVLNYYRFRKKGKARRFKRKNNSEEDINIIRSAFALDKYKTTGRQRNNVIRDAEKSESLYVSIKNSTDAVKGKYIITPYLKNFVTFHNIDDPSYVGEPIDKRIALNWHLSIKYPLWVARHYNQGLFFSFTNTGCFDLTSKGEDSRPVSKKSFMPGFFYRHDLEHLFTRWFQNNPYGVDAEVEFGVYHHSNGGYSALSRSMMAIFYTSQKIKIGKQVVGNTAGIPFSENYLFTLWMKTNLYYLENFEENPGIVDHWGRFEGQLTFEKELNHNRKNGYVLLWADLYLSKGGQSIAIGFVPYLWGQNGRSRTRLPLSPYIKLYQGKNEYLEYYDQKKQWLGIGVMLRK